MRALVLKIAASIVSLNIPLNILLISTACDDATGSPDASATSDAASGQDAALARADAAVAADTGPASDAGATDPDAGAEADSGAPTDAASSADAGSLADAALPDAAAPPRRPIVYVGSAAGDIHRFDLDLATAALTPLGATPGGANPSFLAVDPASRYLFAVNEGSSQVASFSIQASDGALTLVNRVGSGGTGPAHLSVDATGRWVLVANYDDGSIASLPIGPTGRLGAIAGSGDPGRNAHLIITDPANRFAFVPCLGSDRIAALAFDPSDGSLTAHATVNSAAGAGPRHFAFHPSGRWAYAINERDSTVTEYDYDATAGRLTRRDSISTLPAGFPDRNTTAEIVVHPSGRFVYGSNRGHDSIVAYTVDPNDGSLTFLSHTPTGGSSPRSFALTPDGSLLLVANQLSHDVFAMRIDPATGAITELGKVADVSRPAFVGAFLLP